MEKSVALQIKDLLQSAKGSALGRLLEPLVRFYRRVLAQNRRLRREVSILSGKINGEPISIFFAGTSANSAYISRMAFGPEVSEKKLGKAYIWMIPLLVLLQKFRGKCQLSIVEAGKRLGRFGPKGFFVPCWTGGFVDASDESRQALKSIRWDMQKIKRFQLSPEVSTDPALYDFFYQKMHLPFIKIKHGGSTVYARWDEVQAIMNKSELILVKWKGQYIGGAVIIYLKDFAHLWINGIVDGNREHLKLGVIGAIDHFAEKRLLEKGYRKMHYGASRPFLKDGVLNYKRNRGLVLNDFIDTGFLLTPLDKSGRAKKFFLENPFLYLENGQLTGAVFGHAEDMRPDFVAAIHADHFIKGMRKLNIFIVDEGEVPEVPPGLKEKVTVSKLLKFFSVLFPFLPSFTSIFF